MEKLELEQKIHYGLDCQHFNVLAHSFAEYSKYQGFECSWETVPEKLCLIHSEVSEALEAHRKDDKENFAEEIADIIIRCFDLAGRLNIDIHQAIYGKMMKNLERPLKHGKKY